MYGIQDFYFSRKSFLTPDERLVVNHVFGAGFGLESDKFQFNYEYDEFLYDNYKNFSSNTIANLDLENNSTTAPNTFNNTEYDNDFNITNNDRFENFLSSVAGIADAITYQNNSLLLSNLKKNFNFRALNETLLQTINVTSFYYDKAFPYNLKLYVSDKLTNTQAMQFAYFFYKT